MGGTSVANYIGRKGEVFYNPDHGALYISDGHTVGGIPIHIHDGDVVYNQDIIPDADNAYNLGSNEYRWKSIHIGPGTIYITDVSNSALTAALTVNNGVLQINGADQLQVGQLKFVNNTIESATSDVDIQIGLTGSSANLVLNRNVVMGADKTLTFSDSTTQNTAFNDTDITLYESIKLHTDKQNTDNEYLSINVVDDHAKINFTGGSIGFNNGLLVSGVRSSTNDIASYSSVIYKDGEIVIGTAAYAPVTATFNPNFCTNTGNTLSVSSQSGSYTKTGKICYFRAFVQFGNSTYADGSGQYQITLPFPAAATVSIRGGTLHNTNTASIYHIGGVLDVAANSTVMPLYYSGSTTDLAWKNTTPVGWMSGNTSHFDISGVYETT